MSDGKIVYIKRVRKATAESDIVRGLSLPHLRENSQNHAVPILDFLSGEHDHDYIVMPLLLRFDDPPFVFVEEVSDFVRQTLEVCVSIMSIFDSLTLISKGLAFLHQCGVA